MHVKATETPKPPYGPFRTYWNFIEQLHENGPLPQLLDRSQMGSRGGSARSELYSALRFFGLIDDSKAPTQALRELVEDHPDTTKLRALVEAAYGDVIALNLTTATPKQVDEKLMEMGAMPNTVQRARLFCLNAFETVGVEVGNPLKSAPRSPQRRKPRKTKSKASEEPSEATPSPAPPATPLAGLHPAILTLVQSLPEFKDHSEKPAFSEANRDAWFAYAKATFNLIYALPEDGKGSAEVA